MAVGLTWFEGASPLKRFPEIMATTSGKVVSLKTVSLVLLIYSMISTRCRRLMSFAWSSVESAEKSIGREQALSLRMSSCGCSDLGTSVAVGRGWGEGEGGVRMGWG